eukprot:30944-Pelagococcus_subviridis.AAC.9
MSTPPPSSRLLRNLHRLGDVLRDLRLRLSERHLRERRADVCDLLRERLHPRLDRVRARGVRPHPRDAGRPERLAHLLSKRFDALRDRRRRVLGQRSRGVDARRRGCVPVPSSSASRSARVKSSDRGASAAFAAGVHREALAGFWLPRGEF